MTRKDKDMPGVTGNRRIVRKDINNLPSCEQCYYQDCDFCVHRFDCNREGREV